MKTELNQSNKSEDLEINRQVLSKKIEEILDEENELYLSRLGDRIAYIKGKNNESEIQGEALKALLDLGLSINYINIDSQRNGLRIALNLPLYARK
jgi:hypothetical protein